MSKEIEVKYLVKEIPRFDVYGYDIVSQGYLSVSDTCEVRIRKMEPPTPPFNNSYALTIKSLDDNFRTEVEKEITKEEFDELWKLTSNRISKNRHYGTLKLNGGKDRWKFELDEFIIPFRDKRLLLVEVEFKDLEDYNRFNECELPNWIGDEVTTDSRYKNRNIRNLQ